MIAFEEVIPTVYELVKGIPYFAGENVIVSTGYEDPNVEGAILDRGFCVTLSPIMSAPKFSSGAATLAIVEVKFFLIIQVNPKTNEGKANKNIWIAVKEVIRKLKSYKGSGPSYLFDIADDTAIDNSGHDEGLWAYDLSFKTLAAI